MSEEKHNPAVASDAIADAIRAKRDGQPHEERDWAAIADELISEIEAFDLDRAEQAVAPPPKPQPTGRAAPGKVLPNLVKEGVRHHLPKASAAPPPPAAPKPLAGPFRDSPLLGELRQKAWQRQQELHLEQVERTAINEAIDRGLRQVFGYVHELIKQLNIVKPLVARDYSLQDTACFANLCWQEGFADYRSQSPSAGALLDEVSVSYQLAAPERLTIGREGPGVERLRQALFDYGLRFQVQEVRDSRRHLLRAEFDIKAELSVNARWRADYGRGMVTLDTRNLERLGSYSFTLAPEQLGRELLDEFGRLVLGEPNRFREFCRR